MKALNWWKTAVGLMIAWISASACAEYTKDPDWRDKLPRPIYDEAPELIDLYYKAWEVTHGNIDFQPGLPVERYMDDGHASTRIWPWDTILLVAACKYCPEEFPGVESLELYYKIMVDGFWPLPKVKGNSFCGRDCGKMLPFFIQHPDMSPLYSWAEYEHALQTGDRKRLEKVYLEKRWLQRIYERFETFDRRAPRPAYSGMPITATKTADGYHWGGFQSADNTPRGRRGRHAPGSWETCPNDPDLLWVDAIAMQGLNALSTARIAALLGRSDEAKAWQMKYEAFKRKVNELYWDEQDGFYYDIFASDRSKCKVMTIASYWPMMAGMPTPEMARRMEAHFRDPNTFGGEVPTPTLARNDPDFHSKGGYWRGSIWMLTTHPAIKAINAYGNYELAREVAQKVLMHMAKTYHEHTPHEIWECYSPTERLPGTMTPSLRSRPGLGFATVGPITLLIEDVIGVKRANAFENTLTCSFARQPKGRVGVRNYRFGKVTCSIVATVDEIRVESNGPFTLVADGRHLQVGTGKTIFIRKN